MEYGVIFADSCAMDLKMFLNAQLIDTIPVNPEQLSVPSYIYRLQMVLEERNEEILDLTRYQPQFFIDQVPSKGISEYNA